MSVFQDVVCRTIGAYLGIHPQEISLQSRLDADLGAKPFEIKAIAHTLADEYHLDKHIFSQVTTVNDFVLALEGSPIAS
jgi:hypothetical protein